MAFVRQKQEMQLRTRVSMHILYNELQFRHSLNFRAVDSIILSNDKDTSTLIIHKKLTIASVVRIRIFDQSLIFLYYFENVLECKIYRLYIALKHQFV